MIIWSISTHKIYAYDSFDTNKLLKHWERNYKTPQDYVVDKFKTYNWVFLGEYHRIKHDVDLINSLIPLLHEKTDVRVIAIEFLNNRDTDKINMLVTAKGFNRKDAIEILKNYAVFWPYEEYLQIFKSVWESNQKHAKTRGAIKLFGLQPYNTSTEKKDVDMSMADYFEESILKNNFKALVYTGEHHSTIAKFKVTYDGQKNPYIRMGNYIYKTPYKSKMFFIRLHSAEDLENSDFYMFDGKLDVLMKQFQKDIGFDVVNTPFGKITYDKPVPKTVTAYSFGQMYDGYIMFKTPIKEYVGVTCIKDDWVNNEEEYKTFWHNIPNKVAAERYRTMPFEKFKQQWCHEPSYDYGAGFSQRFDGLPNL